MPLTFSQAIPNPIALHLITKDDWETQRPKLAESHRTWAKSNGFAARAGQVLVCPDAQGGIACAMVGYGGGEDRQRQRFTLGGARAKLPKGTYALVTSIGGEALEMEYLGWLLAGYVFDRYAPSDPPSAELVGPKDAALAHRLEVIAAGEALTRTLINTPAADMGPPDLEEVMRRLAAEHEAGLSVITGADLLLQGLPMIHAVGRAANHAPRLLDLSWGEAGPKLTLVGKGVCFDTGGLNLKPSNAMGLMKKDMGGAATVLGLAHMIMAQNLRLRLRVLVPAVENSVSAPAFRPGDVLTSRKGLTVEINNTDAEGRLVLADALCLADEDAPALIVSMATLTGAARVAVGPDIAPFYTDTTEHATALETAAAKVADPVWRMPFHAPYETMIEPDIADLDNAPKGGFAGSITAALFLRRFVEHTPYMHFDIYGWQPSSEPGRPKGGVGQGARAFLEALPNVLDL